MAAFHISFLSRKIRNAFLIEEQFAILQIKAVLICNGNRNFSTILWIWYRKENFLLSWLLMELNLDKFGDKFQFLCLQSFFFFYFFATVNKTKTSHNKWDYSATFTILINYFITLSWRKSSKSMDWFLYDRDLCYKLNEITLEKTIKLHSEEILSNLYLPIVPTVEKLK